MKCFPLLFALCLLTACSKSEPDTVTEVVVPLHWNGSGDSLSRYFRDHWVRFKHDSRNSTWRLAAHHTASSKLDRVPLLPSLGPSHRIGGVRLEVCNSGVSIQGHAVVSGSATDYRGRHDDSVYAEAQVNQEHLF